MEVLEATKKNKACDCEFIFFLLCFAILMWNIEVIVDIITRTYA